MTASPAKRPRGSRDLWLDAAYDLLISEGIEAVKVMSLARRLNTTRTGFYWFFKDIAELHGAMIDLWEHRNTSNLIIRCEMPAANVCEALFNVMDCWLDPALFDSRLDLAIRNWARVDPSLKARLDRADAARLDALTRLFARHGYAADQARVRAMTVIYTQIGYISMEVREELPERLSRVQHYVEVFASVPPSPEDVAAFIARHGAG